MFLDVKFGDMFYSDFFKANCVVVKFKDEDNWWFVAEDYPVVIKAQCKPGDIKNWAKDVETKEEIVN